MNSLRVQQMMRAFTQEKKDMAAAAAAPAPAPRAPRKPKPEAIEPETESESDSGSESSSYDSYEGYEAVDKIKAHFDKEPCEFISPAGLSQAKTTKEAVQYLESKKCPKIHRVKNSASKRIPMEPASPAPATAPAVKKRVAKPKAAPVLEVVPVVAAPAPAPAPAPAKKVKAKKVIPDAPAPAPSSQGTPLASAPSPPKIAKVKRAPTAYAAAVGRHRKAGLSFADAAKAAKAECDAKKTQ